MTPITISKCSDGGYFVSQGDKVADRLGPDEALGVVAHALFGDGSIHRFLDTVDGWREREVKHRERMAASIEPDATPPPINVVNVIDHEQIARHLASPEGEKVLLDILNRNKEVLAKALDDGWIEHTGNDCPVPIGTLVDVRFRAGMSAIGVPAGLYRDGLCAEIWAHTGSSGDILWYRLHKSEPTGIDSDGGAHD